MKLLNGFHVFIFDLVKIILAYSILFLILAGHTMYGQGADTIKRSVIDTVKAKREVKKAIYSKARKAALLSAIIPGAGQAYNKQYWKMPIVYAALGGLGYWGYTNNKNYKYFSKNLKAIYDDDPSTINVSGYSSDQLVTEKKDYKKYRDLAIIFGALAYTLNIIDANVAAHLKTFDVSDDVSLQLKPYTAFDYNNNLQTGLSIRLNFK